MKDFYQAIALEYLSKAEKDELTKKTGDLTERFDQFIDYLDGEEPHTVIMDKDKVIAASFQMIEHGEYRPEIVVAPEHQHKKLGTYLFSTIWPHPDPSQYNSVGIEVSDPESLFFAYKKGFHVTDELGSGVTTIEPLQKGSQAYVPVFQRDPDLLTQAVKNASKDNNEFVSISQALKLWVDNLPYDKGESPLPTEHRKMEDILLQLPLNPYERTFLWTQMNQCSTTPTPAPGPFVSDLSREQVDNRQFRQGSNRDHKYLPDFVRDMVDKISPDVAKNWHTDVVPQLNNQISKLEELLPALENDPPHYRAISSEMRDHEQALEIFLNKYPRPVTTDLDTGLNSGMGLEQYAALFKEAKMLPTAPEKDLTLLGYDNSDIGHIKRTQGTLLYEDEDGNHYKVPNLPYNDPENRKKKEWGEAYNTSKPEIEEQELATPRPGR